MGQVKSIHKGFKSPEAEKFSDVVEAAKGQVSGFGSDFFEQLVGFSLDKKAESPESSKKSPDKPLFIKDPATGQIDVFHAAKHKGSGEIKKHAEKAPRAAEAAIDYSGDFLKSSERASKMEMHEMSQRLQEIMAELKRLVSSSKVLQNEFANVSVDQAPPEVGEYHINFLDWLLLTVRAAREKVEDSGAWLAAAKKKSGKKGGYWGMFKKHGTTFGLSNERSVATQTG